MIFEITDNLLYWSSFIIIVVEQLFLLLNLIICVDICLILRNPFKPQRMRNRRYIAFVVAQVMGTILVAGVLKVCIYTEQAKKEQEYPFIVTWVPLQKYPELSF